MRIWLLSLLVLVACHKPIPNTAATDVAQNQTPTFRLPNTVAPTGYKLDLTVDPTDKGLHGRVEISVTAQAPTSVVWLHAERLHIAQSVVILDGQPQPVTASQVGDALLRLDLAKPLRGEFTIALTYAAGYEERDTVGAFRQFGNDNAFIYTQFEATYARRAMPCFDEPQFKVPWKLSITAPEAYDAVANSMATHTEVHQGMRKTWFAPTKPLPTYLVAFAVGKFAFVNAGQTKQGAPIRVITQRDAVSHTGVAVNAIAPIVHQLETWFDIPYPYDKLDFITVPITVGFGAMENAGLVTISERLLLRDPQNASIAQVRTFMSYAAHEIAHQWFGNLVTMQWWDDLWLNEGFASWMEAIVIGKLQPSWREDLTRTVELQEALAADSLVTARKVREPVADDGDISNAFDGITYLKGQSILHMTETLVGHDTMQRGVRAYLQKHAWGNATAADFVTAISAAANQDLQPMMSAFLDQPGAPMLQATLHCQNNQATAKLQQTRYWPPGSTPTGNATWRLPVCVTYDGAAPGQALQRVTHCTLLTSPAADVALPTNGVCPRWLYGNANGSQYARMALDATTAQTLLDTAWPVLSAAEKLQLFSDITSAVDDGQLPLALAMQAVAQAANESSRYLVGAALETIDGLYQNVADEDRATLDRYVVRLLGDQAKRLGWTAQFRTLDEEAVRADIVSRVAAANEPTLRDQAITLATRWRTVPRDVRGGVLRVAAMYSAEAPAMLLQQLYATPERDERRTLLRALGGVTSLPAQAANLALLLDPKLDIRETQVLLFAHHNAAQRDAAEAFFLANRQAIFARLPSDSTTGSAVQYAGVFTSRCDASKRQDVIATINQLFGHMSGAKRELAQLVEEMDQCIATRTAYRQQLKAFLASQPQP